MRIYIKKSTKQKQNCHFELTGSHKFIAFIKKKYKLITFIKKISIFAQSHNMYEHIKEKNIIHKINLM